MYFHQPIVCFFFSNNASVIVLTKALRSFVCLCLFVSVVTLSEHRTSRNVGTMFVRCSYNVHTMFAQCSYNVRTMAKKVRTMFVQCPTKVRTILYELFGHCTNFVCAASCQSMFGGTSKNASRQAQASYSDSVIFPVVYLIMR